MVGGLGETTAVVEVAVVTVGGVDISGADAIVTTVELEVDATASVELEVDATAWVELEFDATASIELKVDATASVEHEVDATASVELEIEAMGFGLIFIFVTAIWPLSLDSFAFSSNRPLMVDFKLLGPAVEPCGSGFFAGDFFNRNALFFSTVSSLSFALISDAFKHDTLKVARKKSIIEN